VYISVCCVCVLAGGDVSQTLSQFLASRNLSHIEDILVANGFDELDFMVHSIFLLTKR